MPDNDKTNQDQDNAQDKGGDQDNLTPEQKELAELKKANADLNARVGDFQKLVTSPEWAEFLSHKAGGGGNKGEAPRKPTKEEIDAYNAKLDAMPRAEFAALIRDSVVGEVVEKVKKELFEPLAQTFVSERVQNDIALTAAKHDDFWSFKEQMKSISNANPNLNAEQCYTLAKAGAGKAGAGDKGNDKGGGHRDRTPSKGAGEVPGGPGARLNKKDNEGMTLERAVEEAAKVSGVTFR